MLCHLFIFQTIANVLLLLCDLYFACVCSFLCELCFGMQQENASLCYWLWKILFKQKLSKLIRAQAPQWKAALVQFCLFSDYHLCAHSRCVCLRYIFVCVYISVVWACMHIGKISLHLCLGRRLELQPCADCRTARMNGSHHLLNLVSQMEKRVHASIWEKSHVTNEKENLRRANMNVKYVRKYKFFFLPDWCYLRWVILKNKMIGYTLSVLWF